MQAQSTRSLAVIQRMQRIAEVVTETINDLKRLKSSTELAEILRKGQTVAETVTDAAGDAAEIITDAAQEAAGDVQDIVMLALQLYEDMQRNERSLDRLEPKPLNAVETRADVLATMRAIVEA